MSTPTEELYKQELRNSLNTIIAVCIAIRDKKNGTFQEAVTNLKVVQQAIPGLIRALMYFHNKDTYEP